MENGNKMYEYIKEGTVLKSLENRTLAESINMIFKHKRNAYVIYDANSIDCNDAYDILIEVIEYHHIDIDTIDPYDISSATIILEDFIKSHNDDCDNSLSVWID